GRLNGSPHLVKSSGLSACDEAVERAILAAQPLPLPPQTELFDQFRNLNINFRPNEEQ
ncbi:MAG TPA: cell envelope integrity protein TolA, partial [Methylophilaceae bacterium]